MTRDELVEIEAIKRLKYAYSRCLDTKAWDELATLVTPDVVAAAIWPADPPELIVEKPRYERQSTTSSRGSIRSGADVGLAEV